METLIHLDTHVVVWLYIGDRARLDPVLELLDRSTPLVSPMVVLELQSLYEVQRVNHPAETVVRDLTGRMGLRLSTVPFPQLVELALAQSWTRDPFDRLIVATALADNASLLTCDRTILAHCPLARWG